jgi:methylthioribose-1-phosphate isomerase
MVSLGAPAIGITAAYTVVITKFQKFARLV